MLDNTHPAFNTTKQKMMESNLQYTKCINTDNGMSKDVCYTRFKQDIIDALPSKNNDVCKNIRLVKYNLLSDIFIDDVGCKNVMMKHQLGKRRSRQPSKLVSSSYSSIDNVIKEGKLLSSSLDRCIKDRFKDRSAKGNVFSDSVNAYSNITSRHVKINR